jgi:hypothetical protein
MLLTTRLGLEVPQGPDLVSLGPADFQQAFGVLDNAVVVSSGTLVARPEPQTVPTQTLYYATDQAAYYLSNGVAWQTLTAVGEWMPLTVQTGITSTGYTPSARVEGDTVRLKGQLQNTVNLQGRTVATLPPGTWPSVNINLPLAGNTSPQSNIAQITTGGAINAPPGLFYAGDLQLILDGATFTLT